MKCNFIKQDNTKCNANAIKDSEFCFRHDPNKKELAKIASVAGGQNRVLQGVYGEQIVIDSPHDIQKFISKVINEVWIGNVPVPVGTSMGFLSRCWLDAYEKTALESRMSELEKQVTKLRQ